MAFRALRRVMWLVAGLSLVLVPTSDLLPLTHIANAQSPSKSLSTPTVTVRLSTNLGVPASANIDVSAQLNTVLAGIPTPATVVLEGMYRIDSSVHITRMSGLSIVGGPGTGFIRYTQGTKPSNWVNRFPFYPYLVVQESSNITLEGFTIKGPLTAPTYVQNLEIAHGVAVYGSNNVLVKGLTIRGVNGDFLYVSRGYGGDGSTPSNVTFENIYGEIAGRQGIAVAEADGVTFRSVTLVKPARAGVDFEPWGDHSARNITVEDSTIKDPGNLCFAIHHDVDYVTIRRTSCIGGGGPGKFGPDGKYVGPDNVGLTLQDFSYDYRGTLPPTGSYSPLIVWRTAGVSVTRMNLYTRNRDGRIVGSGVVSDSVFNSYAAQRDGVAASVCLGSSMSGVNNIGTTVCR